MDTIGALRRQLHDGSLTARQVVESALERIADPGGEGPRAFLLVNADEARAAADAVDLARRGGVVLPPFAGIPVAVKDLADIEGQVTTAGSTVLADRPPAAADAPAVARLRAAGFIPVGRTNMTEFAYSGLGLNAHHDTPRSPWDRSTGRIPGGSSSGTAVAVADGMAAAGLGTDTGGSCRIPAAFCGIVGSKPTARRVPLDGIVPLAPSLDSVGPLARSVACCAAVDDVFAGGSGLREIADRPTERIRLAAITDFVLEGLDDAVAAAHGDALRALSAAGVEVVDVPFPELLAMPTINAIGGLAPAEAYHWHRRLLAERGDGYDQRIRRRIEPGGQQSAADYLDVVEARDRLIAAAARRMAGFDAFVLPTVAILPPPIDTVDGDDPDAYSTANLLCLRNTAVGNFLDACAISVPSSAPGEAPVGLMLMAGPMQDAELFSVAQTVEDVLSTRW